MRDVTVKLLEWSGQNDFTLQDSLAKGTYGQIYLATHNRSGNDFVVKAVHKHISRSQGESTPHEELLLHKYISKCIPERLHVAKFIAGYEDEKYIYSVMEACHGPTLASLLGAAGGGIPEQAAAMLLQKTATATMHLHSIGVLHRDIKPDNLMLVAPHGRSPLVIIDFGLSLYIGDVKGYQSKWSVGSMLYVRHLLHRSPPAEQESTKAAPEVTNSGYYTTACDVWSLGILLYRMLFGEEPFASFREAADARFPVQFPEDAHQTVSQDAIDLISWMLKHDFHGRPSLQQVLVHDFTRSATTNVDDLVDQWLAERANAKDHQSPASSIEISAGGTEPVSIPGNLTDVVRTSRPTRASASQGMLSAAGLDSSHSLQLDYVELPSLTMPASIRRCPLPSGLEPQTRVHTLSAIADQTWREIEDNVAHRNAKPRDREPVNMSTVQESIPEQPWRMASLQVVRCAEKDAAVCAGSHSCSLPLYPRNALAMDFHETDCSSEVDGWHGNCMGQSAMPHSRSQLSLVDAAISPDLLSASVGSERRLGADVVPCEVGETCTIPQMPVETIGAWQQGGGCELQIGSAPNPSLAALDDAIDALSYDPC